MKTIFKWLKRGLLVLLICTVGLFIPVGYNELACVADPVEDTYEPKITDPDWQRAEARTLMTFPEWHIVHAYDEYAKVISTGDPHDFQFLSEITSFWTSLCSLSEASANHGGIDGSTKQLVYTIGVSFTAEFLLKAAYEETIGRLFALIDGDGRAPLEDLSARQAADYATFLQQVPWYKWDFPRDKAELIAQNSGTLRDWERRIALGLEYGAKAQYAKVIAAAVANVGADELQIRAIVKDISVTQLQAIEGVRVVSRDFDTLIIEAPRYRVFTGIVKDIAQNGGNILEIAGNDDIMYSMIGGGSLSFQSLHRFNRQGYKGDRNLFLVKVEDLADVIRSLPPDAILEHIHDY